ncbi:hypothetical protein ABZY68_07115 [Streptomyces sp. NPDC006482]|uniref:hypothetical protein n=1 Tax=Streptomyces sp. NPDC006482 TaxID=3154306 RepID=UPI0033A09457
MRSRAYSGLRDSSAAWPGIPYSSVSPVMPAMTAPLMAPVIGSRLVNGPLTTNSTAPALFSTHAL